ncbi:MAG: hypothetical protein GX275_07010 [Clostridiales bacterium]|nr:hypothetical protein [Clostridiales bacterium]
MKRFFKNIFILILIVLITISIIIMAGFRNDTFVSGITLKIDLVKTTMDSDKKRIILIGGSNVVYGINSELIESKLNNEYEVINFGLHAGAGLKYYLDIVTPYTKEGDIIIILPEYEHYFNDSFYGSDALAEMIEFYPPGIFTLSIEQYKAIGEKMNVYLFDDKIKRILKNNKETPSDKMFNEHCDLISHLGKEGKEISGRDKILHGERTYNSAVIPYIDSFAEEMDQKGAKVVYDFPPIPENRYIEETYYFIHDKLKNELDVDIIGDKEDYTYPVSYFYDTGYHLNTIGREIRSNQLAEDIENYLK